MTSTQTSRPDTTMDASIRSLTAQARTSGIPDATIAEVMRVAVAHCIDLMPQSGLAAELVEMHDELFFLLVWSDHDGRADRRPINDFDFISAHVIIALNAIFSDPEHG